MTSGELLPPPRKIKRKRLFYRFYLLVFGCTLIVAHNHFGLEYMLQADTICKLETDDPPDTSVIITSSLIPTHPSISIINKTFASIRTFIDGLAHNTPIFISVDGLKPKYYVHENIDILHEYVKHLRLRFQHDPYVSILNNCKRGHISGSIETALEMVETKYIYVIQHDLAFIKHINHRALVNVMEERPSQVQIVRFNRDKFPRTVKRSPLCDGLRKLESHGLKLHLSMWGDNNHLTTKKYYSRLLKAMGPFPRPPEAPMQNRQTKFENRSDCTYFLQYLYQPEDAPHIFHLDGRLTMKNQNNTV